MKTACLFVFSFFAVSVFGQDADSLAVVREVDSLIQVSSTLIDKADLDKAFEINRVAEKISLERLGKETAAYGSICLNYGRVFYLKGNYIEAEKWYLEAKEIREKVLGKENPRYATILNNLASVYFKMGNYKKAEPLYLEAKAIREKVLGKENPQYASSLINLAMLYHEIGDFEQAEPHILEAKSVQEKVLGKANPEYARTLSTFAVLYAKTDNYEKAEPLFLEAKAIQEKALGKEHRDYAGSLHNLANLYRGNGNYEKAELLLLEAKDIREKVIGKEHPDYALSLNNLGVLYKEMGNYKKAELLYLESKAIREKMLGKENKDYAGSLLNLGILYWRMGDYEKAEPLLLEAKLIQEKVLGTEHPDYTFSLKGLGVLYQDMGNNGKAETLFLELKALHEKLLGKEHRDYAEGLHSLAVLYMEMGKDEQAEMLYLEAKAIQEKVLGIEHPQYGWTLQNLAILYNNTGRYERAEPLLDKLANLNQFLITRAFHHLSERELIDYLLTFSKSQARILSFAKMSPFSKSHISQICYDNSLFYKGFLLNAATQINHLTLTDSVTTEKFNLLKSIHRRLANQYTLPIAERNSALIVTLEEKSNTLEKELARTVAGYAEAIRQVKWQEVQAKLKKGEAAVEFVHFRVNFPKNTDSIMYAALLLRPGDMQPLFIPLFEEKQLDSLLQLKTLRRADYVSDLYSYVERSMVIPGRPKKSLGELLWKPLEKHLLPAEGTKAGEGVKTIYYSPSGLLHRLNLAAVSISPDSVLADRFRLVELGSTRQLVVPAEIKPAANDAVLFGGIRYETDTTAIDQANAAPDSFPVASSRGELSFAYADSSLRIGTWNYLIHTEKEVTALDQTLRRSGFKIDTYKGYAATEETFKRIGQHGKPSPRVLHLATHGFFFPHPKTTVDARRWTADDGEPVFKISEHPMIRSGLILAGGNHAWKTGKPVREGLEDGILTAYEISQMNLSNTELVVLSACETGLGDIQGNEGVYGLQRAFKIAGAKYLIMSLWQVPDKQTSLLMTTFYKKWLEDKMAIPEAFRTAQRELREAGLDPYQWAGFVLVE